MEPSENRLAPIHALLPSLLALVFTFVACGPPKDAGPPDPPSDLPGFRAGPVTVLSIDDVASDALDPAQLGGLLSSNGFASAAVRAFSAGADAPIRTVRVEVIAFDRPAGAEAYLGWLHEHAKEFVGAVREEPGLDPPGAFVLSHAPAGCCAKEQVIWVAAWQNGDDAVWIQVMGPRVDRERVGQLVDLVEASV